MNSSDPISETRNTKYILITYGNSYLGRVLAIYLDEELSKHDKKESWAIRVMCAENTRLKREFEKRGIEVKLVDYESQKMIHEAMQGRVEVMVFNPFTDQDRLVIQAKNVLEVAKGKEIKQTIMLSSLCTTIDQSDRIPSPYVQFKDIEDHLKELNEYGQWVILRIPFIQQYFYFWLKMIESHAMIGMPIAQTDSLQSVHIKDVCDSVAHIVLRKKSMAWSVRPIEKRVYSLFSPGLTLFELTRSLSDSFRDENGPEISSVVLTEEQMSSYFESVARGDKRVLLNSVHPPAVKKGWLRSSWGLNRFFWSHATEDDPRWYPKDALTPFCIELMMAHFQLARNPQWIPTTDNLTDVRDLTGSEPISVSIFFKNNRNRFRGSL